MTETPGLERLDQTDLALGEGQLDLRNRTVVDAAGDEVGAVDALYVDTEERRVRMLLVRAGGFVGLGATEYLVPVEAIDRIDGEDRVHLGRPRADILGAPRYDPELVETSAYWDDIYGYYGYAPYWGGLTGAPPPAFFERPHSRGGTRRP